MGIFHDLVLVDHASQPLDVGVLDEIENEEDVDIEDDDVPEELVELLEPIDGARHLPTIDVLNGILRNIVQEAGDVVGHRKREHEKDDAVPNEESASHDGTDDQPSNENHTVDCVVPLNNDDGQQLGNSEIQMDRCEKLEDVAKKL